MPWGADQFDNSGRVLRHGGARELPFRKVTAKRLAAALQELLRNESVATACRDVAGRFPGVDPFAAACDASEAFARMC